MLTGEDLTPAEVAAITGTPKPARQAAELAKRGIAHAFTGSRVNAVRADGGLEPLPLEIPEVLRPGLAALDQHIAGIMEKYRVAMIGCPQATT